MKIVQTVALAVLFCVPVWAQSGTQATPNQSQRNDHSGMMGQQSGQPGMMGQKPSHSGMTASCQEIMQEHQKMMSAMQQMDSQLQAKVSTMNSATGDKKIQAIVDVVNELASQRHQMFARVEDMQSRMMAHFAEHMQSGGAQSLANCLMMQQGMGQAGMQGHQGTGMKPASGKSKVE
jgi:uncharacterized protein YoxC